MCARSTAAAALIASVVAVAPAWAADQSTSWMTNPRHDGQLTGSPLQPPLAVRWDVRLGVVTSNVIAADGRVVVVRRDAAGAPQLTALDAATGGHLWSVATPAARIAYESGRVYATQGTGIAAFSAATGARLWTTELDADYGVPHVTADGGVVYALVGDSASRVAAVRGSDGAVLWTSPMLFSGESAPAVDAERVYVGFGGGRTIALSRATGQVLWHHETCCTGGGGTSVVLNGGLVYAEAWSFKVLDAATGQTVGSYINHNGGDHSQPAFAPGLGIFRPAMGLVGAGPDGTTKWSFAAEGAQRPVTANGHAYTVVWPGGIGDGAALVALDLQTGAPAWCADLGIREYPDGHAGPVSGGLGMVLVPVDDRLVAYGNGGAGSTCGAGAPPPVPAGPTGTSPATGAPAPGGSAVEVSGGAPGGPRLTLRAARTKLVLGERTRLTGVVSGVPLTPRPRVRIEADDHPFGGWRTLARPAVRADGRYGTILDPAKNVRLRAVLEHRPPVVTNALTVWTELPALVRRLRAGSARPAVRVEVLAPPRAGIRKRRVAFYLARATDSTWVRTGVTRWTRRGRLRLVATMRFPAGRLGQADRVLVCTREPRPDAFGEPSPLDRACGARRLPRTR